MGKDRYANAEKVLNKAELYLENESFKKAGKNFKSAGDLYLELNQLKIAKECYFYASKSYLNEKKYELVIENLRNAAGTSIFLEDYESSYKFFKNAAQYVSNFRKIENRNYYYLLYSTLSYLCLFLGGKQEIGLDFIKEIRKNVESEYFKDSSHISLVKNLEIALRDKNNKYLKIVEENYETFDFNDSEKFLLKKVIALAKCNNSLKIEIILDKEQYTTRDIITLTISMDTSPLLQIIKNSFYNINFNELKVTNIILNVSDNITAQKKPQLPLTLKIGDKDDFIFLIKPHFQLETPFIGPIILTCEIDKKFVFNHEIKDIIKPNIISPPPSLDITMKNLRPPLIGKTFPMEFFIENKSEGDALDLTIEIEFPDQLKVMRGTTKKQIYSLSSNENLTWELNLKPTEPGDYVIKMDMKFKDPDGNNIESKEEFPFAVKL
jgi:tetratricopeptide (TPR) repeat protein